MIDALLQAAIGATGIVALLMLLNGTPAMRMRAPLVGLAGQPFWLVATWNAGQTGMFVVAAVYTVVWAIEAWRRWRH